MKTLKILFALSAILFFTPDLSAYDARPPCYKDLERNFFSYKNTSEALALWKVQQPQWDPLIKVLQDRQREAETVIHKKAQLLRPNPLEAPFQADVARDLLKQTMYQIFLRCVLENGFFDTASIDKMFEFIWTHESRLKMCLPESK